MLLRNVETTVRQPSVQSRKREMALAKSNGMFEAIHRCTETTQVVCSRNRRTNVLTTDDDAKNSDVEMQVDEDENVESPQSPERNDDDYEEDDEEDEQNDENEDEDAGETDTAQGTAAATPSTPAEGDDAITVPKKRGRGRPRKYPLVPREDGETGEASPKKKVKARNRKRESASVPLDEDGNPYEIQDDEVVLPEDPSGEEKITKDGELLGGRDFRVRTFTVLGRGRKLYMLSTEPARCMGFRDSYLLFQKHRRLYKVVADEDEKFDLIHRDIIPHSYKGRSIGLVTARSVFREFGAKIIIGGRRVKDDYYEAEALASGFTEDVIADPDDKLPPPGEPYNKNQYVAWHGASQVYHQYTVVQPFARDPLSAAPAARKIIPVTDDNWMVENARAASNYNSLLRQQRAQVVAQGGTYEPHTGVVFCPRATQPTRAQWVKVADSDKESRRVVVETVVRVDNAFTKTGLKDVPPELFSDCVDDEVKKAILLQQERERQW